MAKRASIRKKEEAAPAVARALGPGLHAGTIELRSAESVRVRLLGGEVVSATVDDAVEPELIKECQRHGRRVIVADGARGPVILGALQTTRPVARDADGNLSIAARKIRLKAEQALVVESGEAALRLDPSGLLRLEGDKMVVDIGSLVRFLAARVEFP